MVRFSNRLMLAIASLIVYQRDARRRGGGGGSTFSRPVEEMTRFLSPQLPYHELEKLNGIEEVKQYLHKKLLDVPL